MANWRHHVFLHRPIISFWRIQSEILSSRHQDCADKIGKRLLAGTGRQLGARLSGMPATVTKLRARVSRLTAANRAHLFGGVDDFDFWVGNNLIHIAQAQQHRFLVNPGGVVGDIRAIVGVVSGSPNFVGYFMLNTGAAPNRMKEVLPAHHVGGGLEKLMRIT